MNAKHKIYKRYNMESFFKKKYISSEFFFLRKLKLMKSLHFSQILKNNAEFSPSKCI